MLAAGAVALSAAGPAMADSAPIGVDTSACTSPLLSQPFLAWNDSRNYALVPGQSPDNFDGTGWTLSGGAQIIQATLDDGTTGSVLDLPRGSSAESPVMCVTNAYPKARTMVMGNKEVKFAVAYEGTESWTKPKEGGHFRGQDHGGWALSGDLDMHPADYDGWQLVKFVLTASNDNHAMDTQIYNFYADPYAKR